MSHHWSPDWNTYGNCWKTQKFGLSFEIQHKSGKKIRKIWILRWHCPHTKKGTRKFHESVMIQMGLKIWTNMFKYIIKFKPFKRVWLMEKMGKYQWKNTNGKTISNFCQLEFIKSKKKRPKMSSSECCVDSFHNYLQAREGWQLTFVEVWHFCGLSLWAHLLNECLEIRGCCLGVGVTSWSHSKIQTLSLHVSVSQRK